MPSRNLCDATRTGVEFHRLPRSRSGHGEPKASIRIDASPQTASSGSARRNLWSDSPRAERAEYDARANRIHEVETELETKPAERTIAEQQRRQWHKESDTDTPQDVARQPYRSREKDSGDAFTNSLKTDRGIRKNDPKERQRVKKFRRLEAERHISLPTQESASPIPDSLAVSMDRPFLLPFPAELTEVWVFDPLASPHSILRGQPCRPRLPSIVRVR
jgi:hypothetical protein